MEDQLFSQVEIGEGEPEGAGAAEEYIDEFEGRKMIETAPVREFVVTTEGTELHAITGLAGGHQKKIRLSIGSPIAFVNGKA